MQITFIGQGLSESKVTVGDILKESFLDPSYGNFICLVAFASESAINGLMTIIQKSKTHLHFQTFVGIDQKGTSKEALEALFACDINTYVYYTRTRIIFHPKIYLFEGKNKCRLVIGSSNLTTPGLFQNIEASLMVEFDKPDQEGTELLQQITNYFKALLDNTNTNINALDHELIHTLYKANIVPSESERRRIQEKEDAYQTEFVNEVALNEIKALFPAIKIQPVPSGFVSSSSVKNPEEEDNKSNKFSGITEPVENTMNTVSTQVSSRWIKYANRLEEKTKEGVNHYWSIGKKNNDLNIHFWALNYIIENKENFHTNDEISRAIQKSSKKQFPYATMEGIRALFLSKLIGLIINTYPFELSPAFYEIYKYVESDTSRVHKIISNQIEKFYFYNDISRLHNRHARAGEARNVDEIFHIYPIFFLYQVIFGLAKKGYTGYYLTKFEIEHFLLISETHDNLTDCINRIIEYRQSRDKDRIKQLLEAKSHMDSRFYKILQYNRYLNYNIESITLKKQLIKELEERVYIFNELIQSNKLIRFRADNPETYRKMLYSSQDLIEYHNS